MARVVDLGNGYGRIEKYRSEYASLTFPLTIRAVRQLYAQGIIDHDEAQAVLTDVSCNLSTITWSLAVSSVTTHQWRKAVERGGSI